MTGDAEAQRDAYVRYLGARLDGAATVRRGGRACPTPPRSPFQYAIVRVVPRVERGECLNVGVVLLCRPRRFLGARIALDEGRLAAFAPDLDPADGPAASRRDRADRRRRPERRTDRAARPGRAVPLAGRRRRARSSSRREVHTGLCDDPAAELDHLVATLVRQGPAPFEADPGVAG